ncbi:Maf family protein [Desulfovibrio ferrophilus]|nr:Maf family protein [Desulfovibrio ferrophilus]
MHTDTLPGPLEAVQSIILASGSPRRKDMLQSLGIDFNIQVSPGEEPDPMLGEDPDGYARRASLAKAEAVAKLNPEAIVIGSDTIVVLDNEIMGKPSGPDEAMLMLSKLVGNTHRVVSGCAVFHPGGEPKLFSVSTDVTMGPQPLEVLFAYVATGEPMDKAGAYAIQGQGGFLVESISGSYNNVVGLPLHKLVDILFELRAIRPRG